MSRKSTRPAERVHEMCRDVPSSRCIVCMIMCCVSVARDRIAISDIYIYIYTAVHCSGSRIQGVRDSLSLARR